MATERLEVGALLRRTWDTATAAPLVAFSYFATLSALRTYSDYALAESAGATLLVTIVDFVAGFFLTLAMLRSTGLRNEGEGGGFGVYFAVAFLGGLGMLLGFLLLIIPGIILLVRWWPAFAIALSEDRGAGDSLSEAWRMTEGQFWPILAVMLIGILPVVLVMVSLLGSAGVLQATYDPSTSLFVFAAANVVVYAYSVYSTALAIAVYWMLRGERPGLAETFA